jgi:hypothetical protein
MKALFDQIAREHGVRALIDVAESLPFVLLYVFVVAVVVRVNWRRYSPDEQTWTPGITMALFLSLAFAAGVRCSERYGSGWRKATGSAMVI